MTGVAPPPDLRWTRVSSVIWRQTMRGVVALAPAAQPVELRGSAAGAWQLLDEPLTLVELCERAARLASSTERLGEDVGAALAQLRDHHLIEAL